MISVLVSEAEKTDTDLIISMTRDLLAHMGDERLEILRWDMDEPIEDLLARCGEIEAAIIDVTREGGVEAAKLLRSQYPDIEILIVSNASISPITYLNPLVRAASLLLKPIDKQAAAQTLTEFLRLFEEEKDSGECLLVERRGEKMRIPYQKIIYLEAKDKRVYARVSNVEYGIYDTIDHLAEQMPDEFIRCHRSYIVNFIYIEKVRYSENYIALSGNMIVPLSRSYKADVREAMKGGV